MSDQSGRVLSADEIMEQVTIRFHHDAEFHARTKRAVRVVEAAGVINSRAEKGAATQAAAVAVWLAEQEKADV
jgi:hypothetical protein